MKQLDLLRVAGWGNISTRPKFDNRFVQRDLEVYQMDKKTMSRVKRKVSPQETSLAAYRSLENISDVQRNILVDLKVNGGLTDRDLERLAPGTSPSSVRTRRSELVKLGKVRDSGKREKLPSGRLAIVWCLNDR